MCICKTCGHKHEAPPDPLYKNAAWRAWYKNNRLHRIKYMKSKRKKRPSDNE